MMQEVNDTLAYNNKKFVIYENREIASFNKLSQFPYLPSTYGTFTKERRACTNEVD